MRVGFTGTRPPFTNIQFHALEHLILTIRGEVTEVHHGDCVGADEAFHDLCCGLLIGIPIIIHPPVNPKWVANCTGYAARRDPQDYFDRDMDIVDETDLLIACPRTYTPVPHSGTWLTAGYARDTGKPIWFVYPDGTVVPYKRGGNVLAT
jgi:hypothetical protein